MDVTTIITDYFSYHSYGVTDTYGKSFIIKDQSGNYCPCLFGFATFDDTNQRSELHFIKGMKFINDQVGCTKIIPTLEDSNFNDNIYYNFELFPMEPFQSIWQERMLQ